MAGGNRFQVRGPFGDRGGDNRSRWSVVDTHRDNTAVDYVARKADATDSARELNDRAGVESDANLSPRALMSPTLALNHMRSIAGDMWNELENLRRHWQGTGREAFIQDAIDRYERLAGLTKPEPLATEDGS